jgi:endonuclease YncB( thermonuclease family)
MRSPETVVALLFLFLATLIALGSPAQVIEASQLTFPDQETCGNPMMESQLWRSVTGTVDEVIAPTTIRVLVPDPAAHVLIVKLIGVRAPADRDAANAAISFLRRDTRGRRVDILLNPSDKYFERRKSGNVDGWLGGVSAAMIENGLVAYQPPAPYRMSQYDQCQHRLAQERAKQAGVGIWKRAIYKP